MNDLELKGLSQDFAIEVDELKVYSDITFISI